MPAFSGPKIIDQGLVFAIDAFSQRTFDPDTPLYVYEWEILMHSSNIKNTTNHMNANTHWGGGTSNWASSSSSSTGASSKTSFGDGVGLYDAYYNSRDITKIALVDGSGTLQDPVSNNDYLVYDLVESTGSESIHEILLRLDNYNKNNPSWTGNDTVFGTDSATNFVAGTAKSGTLVSSSGTWEANTAAPFTSTNKVLSSFCIWGVNRDSDNDTQVLCAYAGDLVTGKDDAWRGNNPKQTFWSFWGNDWHSNSQTQTISAASGGSVTQPGIVTDEPADDVYLIAYSRKTLNCKSILRGTRGSDSQSLNRPRIGIGTDNTNIHNSNGYYDFNGSSDYITVQNSQDFAFQFESFTVEVWVNIDSSPGNEQIIMESWASSTGWQLFTSSLNQFGWRHNAGALYDSTGGTYSTGSWYHVVVTRNYPDLKMYINGSEVATISNGVNYTTTNDLIMGREFSTTSKHLDGKISVARVYKGRGFTAEDVQRQFNQHRRRYGV